MDNFNDLLRAKVGARFLFGEDVQSDLKMFLQSDFALVSLTPAACLRTRRRGTEKR